MQNTTSNGKIRIRSRAALTANAIRRRLEAEHIDFQCIRARTRDLNTTVTVELQDAHPSVIARTEAICAEHQVILPNPDRPGAIIDNRRSDIPQAGSVQVMNKLSDQLCAAIAYFIKKTTGISPDIDMVWAYFCGQVADFWRQRSRNLKPTYEFGAA